MNSAAQFVTSVPASIPAKMDETELSKYFSEMGRKGAQQRMKRLSPAERKEIARKAGKASGMARKKKARAKRKKEK